MKASVVQAGGKELFTDSIYLLAHHWDTSLRVLGAQFLIAATVSPTIILEQILFNEAP
jgi:hypothetical protein